MRFHEPHKNNNNNKIVDQREKMPLLPWSWNGCVDDTDIKANIILRIYISMRSPTWLQSRRVKEVGQRTNFPIISIIMILSRLGRRFCVVTLVALLRRKSSIYVLNPRLNWTKAINSTYVTQRTSEAHIYGRADCFGWMRRGMWKGGKVSPASRWCFKEIADIFGRAQWTFGLPKQLWKNFFGILFQHFGGNTIFCNPKRHQIA